MSDILEVLRENPEALTELRSVMFPGDFGTQDEKPDELLQLARRQEEAGVLRAEAEARREEAEARREEAETRREEAEIRRDAAIARMGDAIATLTDSVEGLRGDFVSLRGDVEGVRDDMKGVRGDMVSLGTDLGQLKGLGVVISDDDKRLARRNSIRVYETQLPP